MNYRQIRFIDKLLVLAYLVVGFVPYFDAIDKLAPQFLYLSIINILGSFYTFFTEKKLELKHASYAFVSLTCLIGWSFISLLYAINRSEVLIEVSRLIIYLIAFVNLHIILSRNKSLFNYIPFLISIILIIEVGLVYERFIERFTVANYSRDMGLRAFAGNINITAFSILLKFPFLISTISRLKFNAFLSILILTSYVFCLFLLGSRGANLLFFILTSLIFFSVFVIKSQKLIKKKYIFYLFLSILLGGISNSLLFENNSSLNVVQRSTNLNTSSTQQRLRFWDAAVKSIIQRPFLGVGIGNWKLHATEYDKPFMVDYTVPYHVHNDFLEVFSELGILGFIFYYGIYLWLFFLIYNSIKAREFNSKLYLELIIISALSILVYLADSFLNFPFTRPLMQVQNLFIWAFVLGIISNHSNLKSPFSIKFNLRKIRTTYFYLTFMISGLVFSFLISLKVFKSFVDQQFLMAAGNGSYTTYSIDYVESLDSKIPSITATTIPIETLKANLIYNKITDEIPDDTLHYMISEGKKANPFLPYNEFTKSVLYVKQRNPDSAYVYAKKAFYDIPNSNLHFDLLIDIAEAYRDSTEIDKAINSINAELRNEFYEKYLEASFNIKNNIGLTEEKFLNRYNAKNPNSNYAKIFNTIFTVGKKNVEDGYYESLKANRLFKEKSYLEAAELFENAYQFNPLELSYYENAANSYMQAGKDNKAIEILKKALNKLNPKTGKSEYLLGIIYIGQNRNSIGCKFLQESKTKGFPVDDYLFAKFCSKN